MARTVAALTVGVLFYLMPDALTVGPRWLPLALIAAMLLLRRCSTIPESINSMTSSAIQDL